MQPQESALASIAGLPTPSTVLDRVHSSYAILLTLVALGLVAYLLYRAGVIGAALRLFGAIVRGGVRTGFRVWEALFSWASWPVYLAVVLGLISAGAAAATVAPWLAVVLGLAALVMGVSACLAYMSIDLERYQVERGYKAVHDPMKGQDLAVHLMRYGDRVGVPLLAAAAVGAIGGFALLNQGLYETVGRSWYSVGDEAGHPGYVDFLAYALINLYRIVDLLDLANSYNFLRFSYVRQAQWPAATLLAGFKTFFTLVLLQQIFASIRQGQALVEAIADFWSPHPPIHERARNSLPQHGVGVVRPLLDSLRAAPALTREQRGQLPLVIAGIGPGTVPTLLDHLGDAHEGVRAVAAAALGQLHALDALPALAGLRDDPSELVRQEVVGALGVIGGAGVRTDLRRAQITVRVRRRGLRFGWVFGRRGAAAPAHQPDRVELAVTTLRAALADPSAAVRVGATQALGEIGPAAGEAVPDLIGVLRDADETVRCRAAEALGRIGAEAAVPALTDELADPSPAVQEAAARALGAFRLAAEGAVSALVLLLQHPEEGVRQAAADAIGRIGTLPEEATATLVDSLASRDTLVRAQTAEALGAIGEAAGDAVPALVEALDDGSDRVRAKAAEALGKIGNGAAEVAVPSLVRALRDKDNWVSALAAEALGEMGEAAEEAVPSLVRSLGHINPLVRANAAEALGKMGEVAAVALPALEKAAGDEDGGVRAQALRAVGEVAGPGPGSDRVFLAGFGDADPRVRASAAEAMGQRGVADEATVEAILPLLEDANDQVKFHVIQALPKLAGPTPEVIEGLCRRLLEDDSPWVRETAAQVLGPLGPAAHGAGVALLRAAQTGEAAVREQALRAIAMIQPPEATEAFTAGMKDAAPDVRKVASAGWMKAAEIPAEAVAGLVEALRDPEVQVRANAAHALARLDGLPAEAVPLLLECAADPNDGLRMNAVVALANGDPGTAADTLHHLVEDPNSRIRLIAAGAVLAGDPEDTSARGVVGAALADPALRLRRGALDAVAALGPQGVPFLDAVRSRVAEEEDPVAREFAGELASRLEGYGVAPDATPTEPSPPDPASG
ncbi:MAG TPA: HEAT repeat domain-containing protein [Gemmataceae bacterium]|jgi:HEAT repeat protein|nr:HEAT repeat domain-containing protein [Gemmataceae bacterium]